MGFSTHPSGLLRIRSPDGRRWRRSCQRRGGWPTRSPTWSGRASCLRACFLRTPSRPDSSAQGVTPAFKGAPSGLPGWVAVLHRRAPTRRSRQLRGWAREPYVASRRWPVRRLPARARRKGAHGGTWHSEGGGWPGGFDRPPEFVSGEQGFVAFLRIAFFHVTGVGDAQFRGGLCRTSPRTTRLDSWTPGLLAIGGRWRVWSATVLGRPLRIDGGRGLGSVKSQREPSAPPSSRVHQLRWRTSARDDRRRCGRRAAYRSVQRPRAASWGDSGSRLGTLSGEQLPTWICGLARRGSAKWVRGVGPNSALLVPLKSSGECSISTRSIVLPPFRSCEYAAQSPGILRLARGSHQPSVRFVGRVGGHADFSAGAKRGFRQEPCLPNGVLGYQSPLESLR